MEQMMINLPLLQAAPAAQSGQSGQFMTTLVTFGLVILIFYFLIIRPQNKKQKETQKMISAIKKGDNIVTIGGIRGSVASVKENIVTVKVDENTKIEFSKSSIASVVVKKTEAEKK